jgi:hypothetical protein
MLLEINNPKHVPRGEFVVNFENSLGIISESIPEPISFILIIAWLSLFYLNYNASLFSGFTSVFDCKLFIPTFSFETSEDPFNLQ